MSKASIFAKVATLFGLDGSGNVLTPTASTKIPTITATVGSNALTITLLPCTLDFRAPTLASGVVNTRTVSSNVSLVVPSGASIGSYTNLPSRLVVIAMDNAGTVELAVCNMVFYNPLDETALLTTTVMSAGSTAINAVYSTVARTNLPYRIVAFIDTTQTVAGTWAAAPTGIQGVGGEASTGFSGIGYHQSYQLVTRSNGVTYYNNTGRPIQLSVSISATSLASVTIQLNAVGQSPSIVSAATSTSSSGSIIIPAWASYVLTYSGTFSSTSCFELR